MKGSIERVGADVTISERPRRSAPPVRRAEHRPRGARRRRATYPHAGVRFATGLALIIALAMASLGVEAYVRAGHAHSQIAALQTQITALQQRVAADEHGAASDRRHVSTVAAQTSNARQALARFGWALQSLPSEAQLAGVRNALAVYAVCLPQLQNEIAGLGISWRISPAKPSTDYFKLSTAAPVSASCSSALTGRR